ncbi:MAG TPA: (2Fe-2S)-binding protein [Planctomycetota bacterium]|nr:(2Fe-2S)-binding protein [Planctomycetota bacterium]
MSDSVIGHGDSRPGCEGAGTESSASPWSRRKFLQALGLGATAATMPDDGLLGRTLPEETPADEGALGPGPVPVTLQVDGRELKTIVEPRTTLLDALRNGLDAGTPAGEGQKFLDLTGAKRVCDRASCGACTVIIESGGTSRAVYACSILAVDVDGQEIRTVEGLEKDGRLHPVQAAFVERDGLMCGFCTPGFVMSSVALLEQNPRASADEIRRALDGNICRCGTQCRVVEAVEEAARTMAGRGR